MSDDDLASRAERLLAEAYDPRFCYCPRCGHRHKRGLGKPPPAMVSTTNEQPNGHGGHACLECGHQHLLPISPSEPP